MPSPLACCCCCDGAHAAVTELMLSSSSSSVALILRVASLEERRDMQNDETTSIHLPPCLFKFKESWPTVLDHPLAP